MARLNSMLYRSINQMRRTWFATAIYCFVDLADKRIKDSQAGERHGVFCLNSQYVSLVGAVGPALGLLPNAGYTDRAIAIKSGDRVLLYTDGLSAATDSVNNSINFGECGVRVLMRKHHGCSLPAMFDGIIADVIQYHGAKEIDDDLCLFSFELTERN